MALSLSAHLIGNFVPYYGASALWQDPPFGLITPTEFVATFFFKAVAKI